MKKYKEIPYNVDPVQYIKYVMDQMGFSQSDLARLGCAQRSHISEILKRKRRITFNFIRKFLAASHRQKMAYILIRDYKLRK